MTNTSITSTARLHSVKKTAKSDWEPRISDRVAEFLYGSQEQSDVLSSVKLVGASAQGLATAGYTVNSYSIIHSPGVLTPRIMLSALSRRCRASPGVLTHATRHTLSGLAALCHMPKTKLIGRPVAEIWPNIARTDRLTHTSYHQPTNQPAVLPVLSCSWEMSRQNSCSA